MVQKKLNENITSQKKFFSNSRIIRFLSYPNYYFHKKIFRRLIKKVPYINKKKSTKTETFFNKSIYGYVLDKDFLPINFFGNLISNEFPLLRYFVREISESDIFFDIGANYGFYSLLATELIKDSNIHLFEPNPLKLGACIAAEVVYLKIT